MDRDKTQACNKSLCKLLGKVIVRIQVSIGDASSLPKVCVVVLRAFTLMRAAVNINRLVLHPNGSSIMKQIWLLADSEGYSVGIPAVLPM